MAKGSYNSSRFWFAAAVLLLAPLGVGVAGQPLSMQVEGASDPLTGAFTQVRPSINGAQVDFGYVANMGPQPSTGSRVDGASGDARYIATLDLMITRTEDDTFRVDTFRPDFGGFGTTGLPTVDTGAQSPSVSPLDGSGGTLRALRSTSVDPIDTRMQRPGVDPTSGRGGYYVPPASKQVDTNSVTSVDLYVRLMGQEGQKTTVWFSGPDAPIGLDSNGIEVSYMDVLVATGVPVGQPYRCQISLAVPASEWGHQSANVLFSARRSGQF